ncbi:hypothetical protein KAU11_10400 [Candidatus Babeliales bacterium]|nr:hypothetical protein [Candidatus Babeliales bacterium]
MDKKKKAVPKVNNMRLWDKVKETDPNFTKNVDFGGHKYTAIDPQKQMESATREFGPYGKRWGVRDEKYDQIHMSDGTTLLIVYTAILWYKETPSSREASFPITAGEKMVYTTSKGDVKIDTDATKKVQTNALTKGLSRLGFNADVFLGKYEDNTYVKQLESKYETEEVDTLGIIMKIEETTSFTALKEVWDGLTPAQQGNEEVREAGKVQKEKIAAQRKD